MRKTALKLAATAFAISSISGAALAQLTPPNEQLLFQCLEDCQDFQPDARTVRACENYCYRTYPLD